MEDTSKYALMGLEDFEKVLSDMLSGMGYTISSIRLEGDMITIRAKTTGKILKKAVFEVHRTRKVSKHDVSSLLKRVEAEGYDSLHVISLDGFQKGVRSYCGRKSVEAMDGSRFLRLIKKEAPDSAGRERHILYTLSFGRGIPPEEAEKHFKKILRKGPLGFGAKERIMGVECRYTPLGRFKITEAKADILADRADDFYVDLNSGLLYYVTFGLHRNKIRVRSSDVLAKLLKLPMECSNLLGFVFEREITNFHDIVSVERDVVNEHILMLREMDLIEVTSDPNPQILSTLNIPRPANIRYDLGHHLRILESQDTSCEADRIIYDTDLIAGVLGSFFRMPFEFKDVVYFPYYVCIIGDERGVTRRETLLAASP
ncbi:MAG: restriction endonuclease [Candidatus Altiarchaeota archaeon]